MGLEYVLFRTFYEIKRKTGLLKKQFPNEFIPQKFISLAAWKRNTPSFFFNSKEDLKLAKNPSKELEQEYNKYLNGELKFFNAEYFSIGKNYDWLTNPLTHYQYDINKHWTEIEDLDKNAGDIKYVWEKSRFSFLYLLIRYDYHFESDNSKIVFDEILAWINANPLNQGPNYKCSQEISLRILNWIFALNYYKNTYSLTDDLFKTILNSIYRQLQHVYKNINFSRKSVRNNHAITETLTLYLGGLLFPFFKEANIWKSKGKKWFEEEIEYQIYDDGSHLQFSMNYHRVVVQLLTWALLLSEKNNEKFSNIVYSRAKLSLEFLANLVNEKDGRLPNYGANDGALFFKLNECDYRDYRPQLDALDYAIEKQVSFDKNTEDIAWYGGEEISTRKIQKLGCNSFPSGGYYTMRDENSFTFIRCGKHKDRPSQADNLHLDIWVDGENILRDAGSFLYNTDKETINFFNGTKSHNTVILGDYDQMLKGERFIWFNWSNALSASLTESDKYFSFDGEIKCFQHIDKNIIHTRKVEKTKDENIWKIIDCVKHNTELPITQFWNIDNTFENKFDIIAKDADGNIILPFYNKGWYSSYYGIKEESKQILFSSNTKQIITTIKPKTI